MSKHIWCVDTNTSGTNSLTLAAGRLRRLYLTQEEKDERDKNSNAKGIVYLVQQGTIQERERDFLESKQNRV